MAGKESENTYQQIIKNAEAVEKKAKQNGPHKMVERTDLISPVIVPPAWENYQIVPRRQQKKRKPKAS